MSSKIIEGLDASNASLDIINNPFSPGTEESEAWLRGWLGKQGRWLRTSLSTAGRIRMPAQPTIKPF